MKKIMVLLMLCFLAGCAEDTVRLANPREALIKSPANWIERYGDDIESQQTANIALAIQVINRQAEAIQQLDRRLVEVEKIPDPNETNWVGSPGVANPDDYHLNDGYLVEYEIGFRSNGIVAWRKKEK